MSCIVNDREMILSGDVGDMSGWYLGEEGFSSSDVILALAQMGDANDITVRLNSGGGIATEGSAIHSAIARHTGKVTMIVEGVAASAASIIAMAGDEVIMSLGAILMIHDPAGFTVGTVVEHEQQINALTALGDAMATIYAAKSGQSPEACRADMKAETWMTPDQAVAKGYADRVLGAGDPVAPSEEPEPAPFAYRAYRHAPAAFVALADRKNWPRQMPKMAARTPPTATEQASMPTEEEIQARIADAVKADREQQKADQEAEAQRQQEAEQQSQQQQATAFSRADAAEIAEICASGGAPSMTAALIREGVSADTARQRVNAAGQIKDVVALARKSTPHLAADFADKAIASGQSVDAVKASLFDAMAAKGDENPVNGHHMAGAGGADRKAPVAEGADAKAKSNANMKAELKKRGMLPKEG